MTSGQPHKKNIAINVRIAEARQRDVGKGRARLAPSSIEELGLHFGEIVEIIGKRSAVATVWPLDKEDETLNILRIDGQTRKNSGVAIGEYGTVRKIKSNSAATVVLSPVSSKIITDKDFANFVKNRLKGVPVVSGNELTVVVLGNPILFKVQRTTPKGCVQIENTTIVSIRQISAPGNAVAPGARYEEIGGLGEEIKRLREIIELPLRHPEIFQKLGIEAPNGILLFGPPGCGKTLLARALASECEASFYILNGPEIMNKYYGETEGKLRDLFKEAKESAPSIIFIDEIDALAPRREEAFGDVEKRVVAQLLALTDGVAERGDVIVIGATNRPESIDPALRRPGRFDREVQIGVPNKQGRLEILEIHTRGMPLSSDVEMEKLAIDLHGYTGADLRALCREAALRALRKYIPDGDLEMDRLQPDVLEKVEVSLEDFKQAQKEIIPTAMREFYVETPKVRWSDIGGLEEVKRTLNENVIWSIKEPARFEKMGVIPPRGLLLYGPPGCGKTQLAHALATETGANMIVVKGPEILSKWLGESEKAVREIFKKARLSSPCVVFLDEIDSVAVARGSEAQYSDKILSQLLTEIDNCNNVSDIFVVGATNRPDLIDVSLLRPGRLELLVFVPSPDEQARCEILKVHTSKMPLSKDVDLQYIAYQTKGYSGADLRAVCRQAAINAMRRVSTDTKVEGRDFMAAITNVRPALNQDIENWFVGVEKRLKGEANRENGGFIG